jgi:hypothetical protein
MDHTKCVSKKKSFLVHESKKQNVETDGSASSKSHGDVCETSWISLASARVSTANS